MEICPICEGSGKQTVNMVKLSGEIISTSQHECFGCDGNGKVNKHQMEIIEFERNMWCKCKEQHDVTYHPDNEKGATIAKHHYTCNNCKKIYQIG